MEREFVPYEIALALKELGFDEPCFAKYYQQDGNTPFIQIGESEIEEAENAGDDVTFECDSPLYQQAFRWFREKHNIIIGISLDTLFKRDTYCIFIYEKIEDLIVSRPLNNELFSGHKTYEEALEIGLQEALKLIKN